MEFEKLENKVNVTNDNESRDQVSEAGKTKIETKIGIFWKNDGYDDQVPVATESLSF